MEEDVQRGIDAFKKECEVLRPGIQIVIPIRPTQGAFLVSLTYLGQRTYGTIHEDDFADWGDQSETQASMKSTVESLIKKLPSPA